MADQAAINPIRKAGLVFLLVGFLGLVCYIYYLASGDKILGEVSAKPAQAISLADYLRSWQRTYAITSKEDREYRIIRFAPLHLTPTAQDVYLRLRLIENGPVYRTNRDLHFPVFKLYRQGQDQPVFENDRSTWLRFPPMGAPSSHVSVGGPAEGLAKKFASPVTIGRADTGYALGSMKIDQDGDYALEAALSAYDLSMSEMSLVFQVVENNRQAHWPLIGGFLFLIISGIVINLSTRPKNAGPVFTIKVQ